MKQFAILVAIAIGIYFASIEMHNRNAAREYESRVESTPGAADAIAAIGYMSQRCAVEMPHVVALVYDQYKRNHPSEIAAALKHYAADENSTAKSFVGEMACGLAPRLMEEAKAAILRPGS
jgi:hypothetical protein